MPSPPPGYLLVANSAAGSTEREAVAAAVERLARHAPTSVRATSDPAELDDALAAVGERTLVVAGGDGSLHLAVARLRAAGALAGRAFGYVPLGTGNDLARALGVPLDPAAAAEVVIDGHPRPLDLVVGDDDEVVVNAAHAGVGAEAARRAEGLKPRLGRVAYVAGAVDAGLRHHPASLHVEVDGEPVGPDGPTFLVGVANGSSIGGGTLLAPDARLDDGLLDVVVARPTTRGERLRFGAALPRGRHVDLPFVQTAQGHEVTIEGDPIRHNVDGEITDPLPRRTYRLEPTAWTLLGPPDTA